MKLKPLLTGFALLCASLASQASEFKLGAITIDQAYARATVAGQSAGGGFLKLINKGTDDRLVAVSAEVSAAVELHTMKMEGDVMRMRPVDGIDLPAGKTVELKPGGMHLMFMGLKAPLKAGEAFPVKLRFEKAGEVTVQVKVQAPGHDDMHKGMKH
jgi:copper(I)-binding protein